jgi:hypothetical protein
MSEFVLLSTDFSILVWCNILFLLNCKYVSLDSIHIESIRSSDYDIIELEVPLINSQTMCTVLTVFNADLQILMLFYFLDVHILKDHGQSIQIISTLSQFFHLSIQCKSFKKKLIS